MSPLVVKRDGLELPRRWRASTLVFFDDVAAVDAGVVVLKNGARVTAGSDVAAVVARAISPPPPVADVDAAAAAWGSWLGGPRCARRGALALIEAARALGATDVHLEPGPSVTIRVRIEGELVPLCSCAVDDAAPLLAALKGLARCLPYRRDVVQEGRIAGAAGAVAADVRASFVPTALGERAALRLFGRLFTLDELELDPAVLEGVRAALQRPSGLFVVAGATGAGKTTTLYAALTEIAVTRAGAHLSLEDPVEQRLRLAGIAVDQIDLDPARGITAESMLVAALRQDVDVVAVGEVRTPAEARLALHAAHTGRLVLCGIHAGSAIEARQRLLDLGLDATELDGTLHAILHQRLPSTKSPEGSSGLRRRRLQAELWQPARSGPRGVAA
ncbi:MAG: ATPase, T2SS/T4P/T4SS family [Deltaproteobacteria bacterium]|nr:ATPase, T2SS/T4P/T4SS family [Deltaproteobacteria bacterium]